MIENYDIKTQQTIIKPTCVTMPPSPLSLDSYMLSRDKHITPTHLHLLCYFLLLFSRVWLTVITIHSVTLG